MRTVEVTILHEGNELTYRVRYTLDLCRSEWGPYVLPEVDSATLVAINGLPPYEQDRETFGDTWQDSEKFDRALLDADAEKYPPMGLEDATSTDTRI